jgi:hypothetical protein
MEKEPPVVKMEGPIDDLPDSILLNDPLEECPASPRDDHACPALGNNANVNENRLLLSDEQKMEDIDTPHHNDGKNE